MKKFLLMLVFLPTFAIAQTTYAPFKPLGGLNDSTVITNSSNNSRQTISDIASKANSAVQPTDNISNMSVTPTGATSTRTIANKLSEILSVKDFGAKGDDSVDDAPAIQSAIYQVCSGNGGSSPWGSGGRIIIPAGVYKLSTQILIPCNGVTIEGVNNGNTNSGSDDWRGTVLDLHTPDNTSAILSHAGTADYTDGLHIRHMSVEGTNMSSSATFVDYSWLQHSSLEDISARNITNFFREEGGAANLIQDVVILGISGTGVEFYGDASSCGSNSTTVSLAACNMRADLLRVSRVNMNGTDDHTATCFLYHDFAQSLDITSSICENALYGIHSYCSASQGNNGEACPAFARFIDFESENCTNCIAASDVQDWEFTGGYFLGQGTSSTHVVNIWSQNFGGAANGTTVIGTYPQSIRIHGGRYGNSGGSAIYIGESDVIIDGTQVFSSALSTSGAPNIELNNAGNANKETVYRGIISNNILCEASGQQPLNLTQGSVWLTGSKNIKVFGNEYSRCASAPQDNSSDSTNYLAAF